MEVSSYANVISVDPNKKMEKYAQAAAEASGLPQKNFKFIHAVAKALAVSDASMDAVVGTLRARALALSDPCGARAPTSRSSCSFRPLLLFKKNERYKDLLCFLFKNN